MITIVILPIIKSDMLAADKIAKTRLRLDKITYYEATDEGKHTLLYFDHCKTLKTALNIAYLDALFATFADIVSDLGVNDILSDYLKEDEEEEEEQEEQEEPEAKNKIGAPPEMQF